MTAKERCSSRPTGPSAVRPMPSSWTFRLSKVVAQCCSTPTASPTLPAAPPLIAATPFFLRAEATGHSSAEFADATMRDSGPRMAISLAIAACAWTVWDMSPAEAAVAIMTEKNSCRTSRSGRIRPVSISLARVTCGSLPVATKSVATRALSRLITQSPNKAMNYSSVAMPALTS